ncbi:MULTISPECIES: polysaccharide biosynthesis/export family protein [Niastella]|uniref:Polysaccharide biosynthesis/export family protein n=1 Tax=Niastella soli TaxID=2821487 RepID=A0ABS3YQG4_9BACT|nr:polysaccharide biosynthesis/export family protein [Niastella soli]MBO9200134.1 polysaccharide biosynthesis/export family protein [Niastella soli]
MKHSSSLNLNNSLKYFPVNIIALLIISMCFSCTNVKNLQYLKGSFDSTRLSKINIPEALIQKGDLMGITVYSDDPIATAAVTRQSGGVANINLNPTSSALASNSASTTGYLVNQQGDLELYKIGMLHAEGLTKEQLADTLEYLYAQKDLLKNPYVEIRYLNYKITVIGEVNRPGPVAVPTDKLNAFEAVGLAGDITVYGRRDNVLVVRETNGVRQFGTLNLKDPNVFLSPYYYLQQNDLVIVDVAKNKGYVNNQSAFQTISIGATIVSMAAVIISLLRN